MQVIDARSTYVEKANFRNFQQEIRADLKEIREKTAETNRFLRDYFASKEAREGP